MMVLSLRFVLLSVLLAALVSGVLGQSARLLVIQAVYVNPTRADVEVVDHPGLAGSEVFSYMRGSAGDRTRTLTFRQTDFAFHTGRDYISELDPRMIPLYEQGEDADAGAFLAGLGITHVELPGYLPSTYYNTAVHDLVADPTHARLVEAGGGYRLYELVEDPARECSQINLDGTTWEVRSSQGLLRRVAYGDDGLLATTPLSLLDRGQGMELVSGSGAAAIPPAEGGLFGLDLAGRDVLFRARVDGTGLLNVELRTFDAEGRAFDTPVWDGVLRTDTETIAMQFRVPDDRMGMRMVLGARGVSPDGFRVSEIELCTLDAPARPVELPSGEALWMSVGGPESSVIAGGILRGTDILPDVPDPLAGELVLSDDAWVVLGPIRGQLPSRLLLLLAAQAGNAADGRVGLVPGVAGLLDLVNPAHTGAENADVVVEGAGEGTVTGLVLWESEGRDGFSLTDAFALPLDTATASMPVSLPEDASVQGVVLMVQGDRTRLMLDQVAVMPRSP